jgi:GT2 family glycosyltransferase
MDKRSLIGVVTVTFNSGKVLRDFMDSVLKQTHAEFLLYVVDNASSDDTLKQLAEYQDARIVAIPNQENVGVAAGNNIGIRAALKDGCASVLLINNDTVFDSDLFFKLADGLVQYQCDMIVPKILYFDQPDKIWCAGGRFNRLRGYAAVHFGEGELDTGAFNTSRQVEYTPTCCMLISNTVFSLVGLMDEKYFVYSDDLDFCYRAELAGLKLFYRPDARILHKVSSLTGGGLSDFSMRIGTRNRVYFILKNLGVWRSLFYLPAYQFYLWALLVCRVIDIRGFSFRQKAFFEGFRMWHFFSKL